MQNYSIKENYIATEGQKVFVLDRPFVDGTIDVYLNGALQSFGTQLDYVTLPDNGRIIFNKELASGDLVAVSLNEQVDNISMTVLSYGSKDTANALFKRFTSVQKLNFNNRYKISIRIDDKEIEWQFVTRLTPLFTTTKKVLEDIGEFIQGFTEEYISSIIHRHSWDIITRINEATENNDEVNAEILQDGTTKEYTTTTKAVHNWVRIKTEIDLIYARYYGMSYNYGSVSKTIGDISIEKSSKLPYIDELLKRLKNQEAAAEQAIFGGANFIGGYVKGSTSYEYSERGTF